MSSLEICVITSLTSHVKLHFRRAGLMLKASLINVVMTECLPTSVPSILTNVDKEDRAVFITL